MESTTKITDLNDDCLERVFKWMPIRDLCSISATCSRLHDVATTYFATFHSINVQIALPAEYEAEEKIVERFGQHIHNLKISSFSSLTLFSNKFQQQLIRINSNSNVTRLHLDHIEINSVFAERIETILKHVKLLNCTWCIIVGDFYEMILKKCENLEELFINGGSGYHNHYWLDHSFSHLRNIKIETRADRPKGYSLTQFFDKNPNVRQFWYCDHISGSWISKCLKENGRNINELSVLASDYIINEQLFKLERLKHLQIDEEMTVSKKSKMKFINHFAVQNTLEGFGCLGYNQFNAEQCNAISNMTNLKILSLTAIKCCNVADSLCQKLINLEELHLWSASVENVLIFVKNSLKLKKIFWYCSFGYDDLTKEENLTLIAETRGKAVEAASLDIYVGRQVVNEPKQISRMLSNKTKIKVMEISHSINTDDIFTKHYYMELLK